MTRRGNIKRIDVLPDPYITALFLSKFINQIMLDGKKARQKKLFMALLISSKKKTGKDPIEVFEEAMNNVMPVLEVKSQTCWWCQLSGSHRSPC